MKIWKFACVFYLSNWMNQNSFEVLFLDNVLIHSARQASQSDSESIEKSQWVVNSLLVYMFLITCKTAQSRLDW